MSFDLVRGPSNLMPFTLGNPPKIASGNFPNDLVFTVTYRTEREALQKLLPPGLHVPDDPLVNFRYRASDKLPWALGGAHDALGVSVPVVYRGNGEELAGVHWLTLWEDDPMAVILGRELFGVWKLCADLHRQFDVHGEWRGVVSEVGRPMMEIIFSERVEMGDAELKVLRQRVQNNAVFGWKRIPDVRDEGASVECLAYYPQPVHIEQAWTGKGEVRIFETDPDVHVWTHHIVETFGKIPLKECVAAIMTKGHSSLEYAKGRELPIQESKN